MSLTGYRWSFELRDARGLLLATASKPSRSRTSTARLVGSSGGSGGGP